MSNNLFLELTTARIFVIKGLMSPERSLKPKEKSSRPSWDEYFLNIADEVSTRATCDRLRVGAILVRDRVILSTGYNGAPRGTKHCDEIGHRMIEGHCRRTVHAEANAVIQAAREGTSTKGSTLYTNFLPCEGCVAVLINAGVKRIVFRELYKNIDQSYGRQLCEQAGVELVRFTQEEESGVASK